MSSQVYTSISATEYHEMLAHEQGEDRFAERRRIAVMEHDHALRAVVIRSLLRLGCVVSAKRTMEQIIMALQTGPIDGAIICLEADDTLSATLQAANHHQVPIVVLTDRPVEPHSTEQFDTIRFLQKPFDMRELLVHLHLPQKATIIHAG